MDKYRRPDQYYIYEYEKRTIFLLKDLESKEVVKRNTVDSLEEKHRLIIEEYASLNSFFHIAGMRARNKEDSIQTSIRMDVNHDHLVARYPKPRELKLQGLFAAISLKGSGRNTISSRMSSGTFTKKSFLSKW